MKNLRSLFSPTGAQPLFSFSDAEGFFGLMVDNLVQYILIVILLTSLVGLQREFVISSVLPAVAISLIIGNLYYAWLAQRLSAATGRKDVTALPYGINTISVFAFIFLVMIPAKLLAQSQRAALLTSLAGIAVAFLCMDFAARCFAYPLVALLPMGVLLFTLLSRTKLPLGIPGVGLALALGIFAAWLLFAAGFGGETSVSGPAVGKALGDVGFYLPVPVVGDLPICQGSCRNF